MAPRTSRNARFEMVPATPPSCTNSAVKVRHQSPCSSCGARCHPSSMPGITKPRMLVVAVTTNTTAVATGNRWNPNRCRASACTVIDLQRP
jgi:hypothetical protein